MLEEIGRARRSVCIEMYILVDDARGTEFISLLEQKARGGVRVKLVLDSFGSFGLSGKAVSALRASGVEVLFFSRWLHRLHRKLIIIDEHTAITGGVNIHREAEAWADLAVRVRNHRVVRTALRLFCMTYFRAGGKDASLRPFLRHDPLAAPGTSFLSYGPRTKLKHVYQEHIFGAQKTIKLATPYFAPGRWLMAALDAAALRGVQVDVIVPQTTDSWFMDRVNRFYMKKMERTKVRFFLYPGMNHAKVLVLDDEAALVGSQNLDSLSFEFNLESGILMNDPDVVEHVFRIMEEWERESKIFHANSYVRRWYDRILAPLIRLFQPFL